MGQLSFFSAEFTEPGLADLGGLLAAHGQVVHNKSGARLSILLTDQWRAQTLVQACGDRGVDAEVLQVDDQYLVRTARRTELAELAQSFVRGAVKSVPVALTLTPGFLWFWAVAAGRVDGPGFLLGLDPHAPDTHQPLLSCCAEAGLAGTLVGIRGGGPGVRIVGHRRLERLAQILGEPPEGASADAFGIVTH